MDEKKAEAMQMLKLKYLAPILAVFVSMTQFSPTVSGAGKDNSIKSVAELRKDISLGQKRIHELSSEIKQIESELKGLSEGNKISISSCTLESVKDMVSLGAWVWRSMENSEWWVFKDWRQQPEKITDLQRQKLLFWALIHGEKGVDEDSLLQSFVQAVSECYYLDGADCGCERLLDEGCDTKEWFLDRTTRFSPEDCKVLDGFILGANCVGCVSLDQDFLQIACNYENNLIVSQYPPPSMESFFPEDKNGLRFCEIYRELKACYGKCDPDDIEYETYDACKEGCDQEWDDMHSGEPVGESAEDDELEKNEEEEMEKLEICMKKCRVNFKDRMKTAFPNVTKIYDTWDEQYPFGTFDSMSFDTSRWDTKEHIVSYKVLSTGTIALHICQAKGDQQVEPGIQAKECLKTAGQTIVVRMPDIVTQENELPSASRTIGKAYIIGLQTFFKTKQHIEFDQICDKVPKLCSVRDQGGKQ